jgi:ParB-like chromosome segregation protein Spo0J
MDVKDTPISEITPYPGNPRVIPDETIQKVAASIMEFGWQQPIVVDEDGVIIVGHTRYFAANSLGLETVPVKVAADLSPAKVKAYRLLDNKIGESADWDLTLLDKEIEELAEADDFADLEDMLAEFRDEEEPETETEGFLEGLQIESEKTDDQPDENKGDENGVAVSPLGDFVNVNFVVSPDDRDAVQRYLRGFVKKFELKTMAQALVKLCTDKLAGDPTDESD